MKDKFYWYSYKENIKPLMTKEQYEKFENGVFFDSMTIGIIIGILSYLLFNMGLK